MKLGALELLSIGRFSRVSGLTVKALRHYDEIGLLEPAGDPVEVYVSDPQKVPDPKDYVTVIEWPIGPEGELKPPGEDVVHEKDRARVIRSAPWITGSWPSTSSTVSGRSSRRTRAMRRKTTR